jgi:hypothetical protein
MIDEKELKELLDMARKYKAKGEERMRVINDQMDKAANDFNLSITFYEELGEIVGDDSVIGKLLNTEVDVLVDNVDKLYRMRYKEK